MTGDRDPARWAGYAVAGTLTLIACALMLAAGWRLLVWVLP